MNREERNEVNAVKEVEVVLAVFKEYLDEKKDMPYEVIKDVVNKINSIGEDYKETIKELLNCNTLIVKIEKLYEIIGTIGTISVEDEAKLDKTLLVLKEYVKSIED